jgi:hypothetical protein
VVIVDDDVLEQLPGDDDLVSSATLKKEFGKISDMTVWRWQRDPDIRFPLPDIVINNRNYWWRRTLRQYRRRLELESRTP